MIIYKITNKETGKVYIGQTTRTLNERMQEHCRKSSILIDKSICKHGIDSFTVEEIDSAETLDELNDKETYWIKKYDCMVPNGYNMCEGGGNTKGYHHSDETKAKMRACKEGMYFGTDNPFYGKKHTEETKRRLGQKRKGMAHLTPEQRKKLWDAHRTVKVLNVETGEVFESVKAAAEKHGIAATHITRVCKGKGKSAGGYHWKYA